MDRTEKRAAYNSTFAIGGVSYSADSLVVAESFVLRINISGKNPAHRVAAKRQDVKKLKLNAMRMEYFKKFQVAVRVF
jgi:hypothetical protein